MEGKTPTVKITESDPEPWGDVAHGGRLRFSFVSAADNSASRGGSDEATSLPRPIPPSSHHRGARRHRARTGRLSSAVCPGTAVALRKYKEDPSMTATKKKPLVIVLIVVGALLLIAFAALTVVYTLKDLARQEIMWGYLESYETEAIEYLRANRDFTRAYGDDVTLQSRSMSYSYIDPKKYTGFSLNRRIPASAEEFEKELASLTVSFDLPDLRTLNVRFEKIPEGGVEIVGWEYADE